MQERARTRQLKLKLRLRSPKMQVQNFTQGLHGGSTGPGLAKKVRKVSGRLPPPRICVPRDLAKPDVCRHDYVRAAKELTVIIRSHYALLPKAAQAQVVADAHTASQFCDGSGSFLCRSCTTQQMPAQQAGKESSVRQTHNSWDRIFVQEFRFCAPFSTFDMRRLGQKWPITKHFAVSDVPCLCAGAHSTSRP